MHNTIEIFSAGCFLCDEVIKSFEIGKCSGCKIIVHNISGEVSPRVIEKMKKYKIDSVPSVLINEKIKLVGKNSIPRFCSSETYEELEKRYSV